MPTEDFWGPLPDVGPQRTPAVIVKEQAELLKNKTSGLLIGDVRQGDDGTNFEIRLTMVAPTLGNYEYHILTVRHEIGFYPLTIFIPYRNESIGCPDEAHFKERLKKELSSDATQRVITRLLIHIKSQGN